MKEVKFALLDNIEKYLIIALFILMMGLMVFGIVSRYGFGSTVAWIEQLTRLVFVWLSFSGISYAAKIRQHLKVEAVATFIKKPLGKYVLFIGDLITVIFGVFITYRILLLTINVHQNGQTFSAMPWMPISMLYVSGVLGLAGMTLRTIQMAIIPFLKERNKDKKDMEDD